MRISTILDHIDSGHMALPEFQRGYDWNRDQECALFDSRCFTDSASFRSYVKSEVMAGAANA
jgi:hypothetical protein